MNNKECSAYTKEALVEKASKQLHLTKSNASFLSKEEICELFKTCKGTKQVLLPSTELRVEKDDKTNAIYFISRKSPLTYKDYEVLVKQSPKEEVMKIAKRLKIKEYQPSNKDTVGVILFQIKQHLEDRKAGLDPIKIKGPKRQMASNNVNNVNNRVNNVNNRVNNVNNRVNNVNNRVNNVNNRVNNVNNVNNRMNNVNNRVNNVNNRMNNVNNRVNNVNNMANTSGNVKIKKNNSANKSTVTANTTGNVTIKNLSGRVKVKLNTRAKQPSNNVTLRPPTKINEQPKATNSKINEQPKASNSKINEQPKASNSKINEQPKKKNEQQKASNLKTNEQPKTTNNDTMKMLKNMMNRVDKI